MTRRKSQRNATKRHHSGGPKNLASDKLSYSKHPLDKAPFAGINRFLTTSRRAGGQALWGGGDDGSGRKATPC
jgi:hypothetical protein